jgi:hypothetical protein
VSKHAARRLIPRRRIWKWAAPVVAAGVVVGSLVALTSDNSVSASERRVVTIYPRGTYPVTPAEDDWQSVEVGIRFAVAVPGSVLGIRYYKSERNTGVHTGTLWSDSGARLATATFTKEGRSGWQTVSFRQPVTLTPGRTYTASYHTSSGYYAQQQWTFSKDKTIGNKTIVGTSGVYAYGSGSYPEDTWHNSAYYVDVLFQPSGVASAYQRPVTITPPSPHPSWTWHRPTPTPTKSSTPPKSTSAPAPPSKPSTSAPASPTKTAAPPPPVPASSSGFPSASNTGVPAGTSLGRTGSVTLTQPGQVLQNVEVDGCVTVARSASNAIIRNVRVKSGGCIWLIQNNDGASNVTVQDTELDGQGNTNSDAAFAGYNLTLTRVNIHGTVDGGKLGSNDVIQDSYIHDLAINSSTHNDGLQGLDAQNVVIRHNRIIAGVGSTSAIILSENSGGGWQMRNLQITNNLMAGGAYTVYGGYLKGKDNPSIASNISITNNQFSTVVYPKGGAFGPLTSIDPPVVSVSGNIWADGPNAGKPCY